MFNFVSMWLLRAITLHRARHDVLPAYSPDFSPIEHAFSKLKALLRRVKAQTLQALIDAIAQALDSISPTDAPGYFTDCGFINIC